MSDKNERSVASAGSHPVAWGNEDDDGIYAVGPTEAHAHYVLERAANGKYSHRNPRIVPLYRSPTLAAEERAAIEWAINKTAQAYDDPEGGPIKREAMRGLLQRTK
jgi:hypothetical protein